MGLFVFLVVAAVVVVGPLLWLLWRSRPRPGVTNMVLIWHANSEPDKAMAVGALRSAGITPHVVEPGPYYRPEFGSMGMPGSQFEVWVPARDEERARDALGL